MESNHDRIEAILIDALEIQSAIERQAFIRQACGDETELRAQVAELIENHLRAGSSFLAVSDQALASGEDIPEKQGAIIGPYTLLQKIGEGGMGVVFLAEQVKPVRRQVVVKVIRTGMDSAQVVARFEQERQALAVMDHPNIARVIDGGVTNDGRPYFAMELIQGVPITEYCDKHRLTPRQRLELFIPVCHAVQHAHQKGIIHRDLKPSNVLVTEVDGRPIPKVIDFGVAKAIGSQLAANTLNTQIGSIIGTLEYMSPEQAAPSHEGIDTRSDIYCLGVLLYELLTGTTPLQKLKLKDAAIMEMLRMISEVEPPKPSNRLSTIDELPSVAANRGVEPRALSNVVKGDLDWIVMKSLEKDRNHRYSSAIGLARDIERFLCNEPVEAGPHGTGYRLRKFLYRNRGPVVAAISLVISLIGGIVGTSIGLMRAEQGRTAAGQALLVAQQQRDRAERHYQRAMSVVDRLLTRIGGVQLEAVPHMDETRRRILEDALEFYREILKDESNDPVVRREVGLAWQRVGDIQNILSRQQQAEDSLNRAIEIQRELLVEFSGDLKYEKDYVRSHRQLAQVLFRSGRYSEAEEAVVNMLSRDSIETTDGRSEKFELLYLRGFLCDSTQRMTDAISACEESLELADGLVQNETPKSYYQMARANLLSFLGNLYRTVRRLDEAEKCLQDAKTTLEQLQMEDPGDIDVQSCLGALCINLGLTYSNLNRNADAEATFEKAITTLDSLARDHPGVPNYKSDLAKTHNNIAILHSKNADPARAATENVKALAIFEDLKQRYPQRLEFVASYAGGCGNQGKYLVELDRWEESLDWNTKAIAASDDLLKIEPRHNEVRRQLHNSLIGRAGTYRRLKQFELAIKDYRRSLEFSEGESHANYVNFRPRALAFVGEHSKAAVEAEAIVNGASATNSNFREMANVYATCIEAAGRDASLSDPERSTLAERYAVRSVELLATAAEKGTFPTRESIADLRTNDRLQPIQNRDDFQKLLTDLEKAIQLQE